MQAMRYITLQPCLKMKIIIDYEMARSKLTFSVFVRSQLLPVLHISRFFIKFVSLCKLDLLAIKYQRLTMADKHTESIQRRLRKPRIKQIEEKNLTVPKCSSTYNDIGPHHYTLILTNNLIKYRKQSNTGDFVTSMFKTGSEQTDGFFEDCTIDSARNKDNLGWPSKLKNKDEDASWSVVW
jgi:hypothetical protein